jgi:CrcB protein
MQWFSALRRGPRSGEWRRSRKNAEPLASSAVRTIRQDPRELAAIFAGGAAGALARIALVELAGMRTGDWPWVTMTVNLIGAFALGYFATRLQERLPLSTFRRPFLGTGVCGGLTTFSTMQVELLRMLDSHHYAMALAYALVSIAAGYVVVHAGSAVVRRPRTLT